MFSYSKIVARAYHLTLQHPVLWLFGLFVVGGLNLNFFHFGNVPLKNLLQQFSPHRAAVYFAGHPLVLAAASSSVLLISIFGILITNWSRIMLILKTHALYQNKPEEFALLWKKSRRLLWPVINISLLTAGFMVAVGAGLLLPALVFNDLRSQILFWILGSVVLVPLGFTISCINIFTTLYIIVFKKPVASALQLGTDFFLANWVKILGLTVLLVVIYTACFAAGVGLIFLVKTLASSLLESYFGFNNLALSAIMIVRFVLYVCLWFFVGILSAFFNVALLILFLELNTPVKFEEKSVELAHATT